MQKLFGILLIVLGVWIGMEIYTQGTSRAFGGIFADYLPSSTEVQSNPSPRERIVDKLETARDLQVDRLERQLGETPPR